LVWKIFKYFTFVFFYKALSIIQKNSYVWMFHIVYFLSNFWVGKESFSTWFLYLFGSWISYGLDVMILSSCGYILCTLFLEKIKFFIDLMTNNISSYFVLLSNCVIFYINLNKNTMYRRIISISSFFLFFFWFFRCHIFNESFIYIFYKINFFYIK
jgi:hypothetical protein